MVSVLKGFYGRSDADANALASALLPDVLPFQIGNPAGFTNEPTDKTFKGNGRRLRDDVIDAELKLILNNPNATDNVDDDNGTKITDGNNGTVAAFPYIGPANLPLNGPGTGPNP